MPSIPLIPEVDMDDLSSAPDPVEAQMQGERVSSVREAILSLPPHYRAAIELRHYQELTYAEIADLLGVPISDIRTHLYRARKALGKRLDPDDLS